MLPGLFWVEVPSRALQKSSRTSRGKQLVFPFLSCFVMLRKTRSLQRVRLSNVCTPASNPSLWPLVAINLSEQYRRWKVLRCLPKALSQRKTLDKIPFPQKLIYLPTAINEQITAATFAKPVACKGWVSKRSTSLSWSGFSSEIVPETRI